MSRALSGLRTALLGACQGLSSVAGAGPSSLAAAGAARAGAGAAATAYAPASGRRSYIRVPVVRNQVSE
jgi:hypothetical protein